MANALKLVLTLGLVLAMLPATPAHAALRVLIVSGLGGEPEYERRFTEQAAAIEAAVSRATGNRSHVTSLTGQAARKEALERELRALAKELSREDQVAIVLIGHGSFDGEEYRFNLPGPDITGTELAALFNRLPAGQQLIVNTTSASGAVIESWKRPNRTVITATRSGAERNATRFAQYWAEALASPEADRDKNQTITAAEAFEFATRKVADAFKADAALATEHARMEGATAARFQLARLGDAVALPEDPALAALLVQQGEIEQQIEELKGRKANMDREVYYNELEKVLIALARLDRNIDARRATLGSMTGQDSDARKPSP